MQVQASSISREVVCLCRQARDAATSSTAALQLENQRLQSRAADLEAEAAAARATRAATHNSRTGWVACYHTPSCAAPYHQHATALRQDLNRRGI
jgi:hypothetical protein